MVQISLIKNNYYISVTSKITDIVNWKSLWLLSSTSESNC